MIQKSKGVENKQKLLQSREKINRKAATDIKVCDFSTLSHLQKGKTKQQ